MLTGIMDVTSYNMTEKEMLERIRVNGKEKSLALPLARVDGAPRHVQVLFFSSDDTALDYVVTHL